MRNQKTQKLYSYLAGLHILLALQLSFLLSFLLFLYSSTIKNPQNYYEMNRRENYLDADNLNK